MERYLVEIRQTVTGFATVEAESEQDAQNRATCGAGEFGDQIPGEIEIVSVRPLEPADWV